MSSDKHLNRRDLLRGAMVAAAGAAAVPLLGEDAEAQRPRPYGPFRMGLQSYSLREFKLDEALQKTRELRVRNWEAFRNHIPLTTDPAEAQALKEKLQAARVRLVAHGVSAFTANAADNRKIFESAKLLGIETLSADPTPDSFDSLEKLVEEFGINIAIHNHGPGHRYDKLQQVVDAVKGRHKRIGACVDTGHFLRSRENPVKVIETLGERVYGVHLKDVKDATHFTILGKGDMDLVGVLKALKALEYKHILALEYEENPKDPMADIQQCLTAVREAVQKI